MQGAQFLSAKELNDAHYKGPCKGDIQCVVARLAMQMLSGMQALHDGVKPWSTGTKRLDSEQEPSTSAGSSADFRSDDSPEDGPESADATAG